MSYQCLLGDRSGRIIAEIEPQFSEISWRRNDYGRLVFTIAKNADKVTESNLRFGNRILVQFANGLPNWGGVIDPPRRWGESLIEVNAYSGEYILGQRTTDKGRYFSGAALGTIYQSIIDEANAVSDMGIAIGVIWDGGGSHSPSYHLKDLLTIARDSLTSRLSDYDFDVTAAESSGYIQFTANFFERKGSSKPGVALLEGHNATQIQYNEQGPIVNEWTTAGEGSDWGDERLTSTEINDLSVATYGLRQGSMIYSDVSTQVTLDTHAETLLAEYKDPHDILDLMAIDKAPGAFASYDVGDSVAVELPGYGFGGFSGMVKVLGRNYNLAADLCQLILRVE